MFHGIKELIREIIEFLSSGESGTIKDKDGRPVGVYDFAPPAWSIGRFILLFLILPMLMIDVFTRKQAQNIKRE